MECFNFFASTKSETDLPFTSVVRVESPWQVRQSSSFSLCWARVGRAEPSRKNANVQSRILLETFTVSGDAFANLRAVTVVTGRGREASQRMCDEARIESECAEEQTCRFIQLAESRSE